MLVNCAGCDRELLGPSEAHRPAGSHPYGYVAGRIMGRPYCGDCLSPRRTPIPGPRETLTGSG